MAPEPAPAAHAGCAHLRDAITATIPSSPRTLASDSQPREQGPGPRLAGEAEGRGAGGRRERSECGGEAGEGSEGRAGQLAVLLAQEVVRVALVAAVDEPYDSL